MKILIPILFTVLLVIWVGYRLFARRAVQPTVSSFDLERYLGTWYEIARYDHSFERGMDHVQAVYTLGANGRVGVLNSGVDSGTERRREARGKAHVGRVPGQLRVSFFGPFYSDYNIMELGENYNWALVGSRSPKYLWILSRTPSLPQSTLNHVLELARKRGYQTDKLLLIDQQ